MKIHITENEIKNLVRNSVYKALNEGLFSKKDQDWTGDEGEDRRIASNRNNENIKHLNNYIKEVYGDEYILKPINIEKALNDPNCIMDPEQRKVIENDYQDLGGNFPNNLTVGISKKGSQKYVILPSNYNKDSEDDYIKWAINKLDQIERRSEWDDETTDLYNQKSGNLDKDRLFDDLVSYIGIDAFKKFLSQRNDLTNDEKRQLMLGKISRPRGIS